MANDNSIQAVSWLASPFVQGARPLDLKPSYWSVNQSARLRPRRLAASPLVRYDPDRLESDAVHYGGGVGNWTGPIEAWKGMGSAVLKALELV